MHEALAVGWTTWTLAADSAKPQVGPGALAALVLFIIGSIFIGALANRAMREGAFMQGFFLGNRGLGAWALALTATVQSGGTFMGFPSLVYTHGWVVALWIAGYMVVPITGFGIFGKRLAQLSRKTGAITVPDLFRARFASPRLGLIASAFILFYLTFMMIAQFKAGAIIMKLSWPGSGVLSLSEDFDPAEPGSAPATPPKVGVGRIVDAAVRGFRSDPAYYVGLLIFTVTVVGYTLLGGFLAAVWTDLFQSIAMFFGVLLLVSLALWHAGGLENASKQALANTGPGYVFGPGYDDPAVKGHEAERPREFLPVGIAFGFFFVWVWGGAASPAGLVRIMASQGTAVIRKSIYLLSMYNLCIYLPLIVVCICGRALIPALQKTDEIIPRMALLTTSQLPGGSFIAGLILAAPFGAVMSTVSSYLVVLSSGLVRDIYQRFIHPEADGRRLKRLTHWTMIVIGVVAVLANLNPPQYLQALVVFSSTGAAATFCVPALMLCYWRRANVPGMLAAMLGGTATMLTLYVLGFSGFGGQRIGQFTGFRPYFLLGIDPFVWGLAVSTIFGIAGSLATRPPRSELVSDMFDAAQ